MIHLSRNLGNTKTFEKGEQQHFETMIAFDELPSWTR